MNDLISRQQAIDALMAILDRPNVTTTRMTANEARKLERKSKGFCGYDWMIRSIIKHGDIRYERVRMTREQAAGMIKNDIYLHRRYLSGEYVKALKLAVQALEQPERQRGRWIDKSDGIEGAWNYCSVCGEQAIDLYDFCPSCGAKMEG